MLLRYAPLHLIFFDISDAFRRCRHTLHAYADARASFRHAIITRAIILLLCRYMPPPMMLAAMF